MFRLRVIQWVLSLAALVFIAKPFIGFSMLETHAYRKMENTIMVKAFSKRKPDYLQDSTEKKKALHQLLNNPDLKLLLSYFALLTTLLPAILYLRRIAHSFWDDQAYLLFSQQHLYLLTGKLTI